MELIERLANCFVGVAFGTACLFFLWRLARLAWTIAAGKRDEG